MSNAANENVTALIAEVEGLLIEIPGETRNARFTRVRRLSERLENHIGGYAQWSPEAKALTSAVGRVFAFRSWGTK